jgi:translation elongation factor EF-4
MVFQGLFPTSADQFEGLRAAVERQGLTLVHTSAQPEPFLTQNIP